MGTVAVLFLASDGTVFARPGSAGATGVRLPGYTAVCAAATRLGGDNRAKLLWVLVVGLGGLAGHSPL